MDQLLAKPDVPLVDHLGDVLRLGRSIADDFQLDNRLRMKALLACALHDIGKATVDFQEYIRGQRRKAYPHALASLPFILVAERKLGQRYGWDGKDLSATAAVLTHHSPLGPQLYKGYRIPQFCPELPEALKAVWELLKEEGIEGLPDAEELLDTPMVQQSPADLLDESLSFDGERQSLRGILQNLPPQEFAFVKTVLHLADWLASAKVFDRRRLFLENGKGPLGSWARGRTLRDFQRKAEEAADRDVLWLRAPTGTGKTEALLLWAGHTERILYLLPTQATVNAMWKRLRRLYGDDRVALAHGRASYMVRKESDEDPLDARLFGSVFAKPITVATLDQYILAHLHGRHWEERRSLARRATVIVDEIHAYEPYTLGLLLEALDREPPARLALASATLPDSLLKLFPVGTLIKAEPDLWARRRHRVELRPGQLLEDGLQIALESANSGRSVLVVANTVRDAQAFYRRLRDEVHWPKRALLHARFILRDRQVKEDLIGSPEPGLIAVTTQVVEVSLDISYDVLVTEIAPVDALVQRMGRANRKGENRDPAPVVVYDPPSEGSQHIYGRELLDWSREVWQRLPESPTDRDLAEATYRFYERVTASREWQQELQEGRQTLAKVQDMLGCYTIDLSDEEMRQLFTARRGYVSVEVLPSPLVSEAYSLKEKGESWRLPELMVPVPLWWLKEKAYFSPVEDLHCMQTTLEYDPELGLSAPTAEQGGSALVILD